MKTALLLTQVFLVLTDGRGIPETSSISSRTIFAEPTKEIPGPEKNYTGLRVNKDATLLIYHHEQTIAVVEVDENRVLYNCELLEVRTQLDKNVALASLKPLVPTQIELNLENMLTLMRECQKLESPSHLDYKIITAIKNSKKIFNKRQFSSLFSGVFPGTKWCGAGDIADSYFDLGEDKFLDKCCRTHDLCPVKVLAYKTQYNITNYSLYTKSHCKCDNIFFDCLKSIDSTRSNFLGNIYFNVARFMCVEDEEPNSETSNKKKFASQHKKY